MSTDLSLDTRENRTNNAPMEGESTGERIAAVSRAQRDRLIDRVRNTP